MTEIHEREWTAADGSFVREITVDSPRIAVVVAHGAAEHSGYWRRVATRLAEDAGARVLVPDLPGHGRSPGERLVVDEDALVGAIDRVVERHRADLPDAPIVLLGHSMGGLAATRFAQRSSPGTLGLLVLHAAGLVVAGGWDAEPRAMTLEQMTPDPDLQRLITTDELRSDAPIPGETRRALGEAADRALRAEPLGPLPLVWLQGQEDALVPVDGARRSFGLLGADRGAFLSYPGIGHGGILERAGEPMLDDLVAAMRLLLPRPAV